MMGKKIYTTLPSSTCYVLMYAKWQNIYTLWNEKLKYPTIEFIFLNVNWKKNDKVHYNRQDI